MSTLFDCRLAVLLQLLSPLPLFFLWTPLNADPGPLLPSYQLSYWGRKPSNDSALSGRSGKEAVTGLGQKGHDDAHTIHCM